MPKAHRCPRHRGYRPEAGEAAIRGACPLCYMILAAHSARLMMQRTVEETDRIVERAIVAYKEHHQK